MRTPRAVLLVASWALVAFLLGGVVAVRIRAEPNPYESPVLFAEIVSLVLENYVDPVDPDVLLRGAYEGLLGGLDPNGAYLAPDEVRDWRVEVRGASGDPGVSVLKSGGALAVVAVDPGSPAEIAGVAIGDRIRTIAERKVSELSLEQSRRLLRGEPGTKVKLGLVRAADEFRVEDLELVRKPRGGKPYEIEVRQGTAVLRIRDLTRVSVDALAAELADVRGRGIGRVIVDLRDVAEGSPRQTLPLAAVFFRGAVLELRDRSGQVVETLRGADRPPSWDGQVFVLVNHSTSGGAEALAKVLHQSGAKIFGGKTFGLAGEAELVELENGSGLLISVAQWEVPDGGTWNGDGITPDREVLGSGTDFPSVSKSQLEKVLELLEQEKAAPATVPAAA